jgi:hypothetical protein
LVKFNVNKKDLFTATIARSEDFAISFMFNLPGVLERHVTVCGARNRVFQFLEIIVDFDECTFLYKDSIGEGGFNFFCFGLLFYVQGTLTVHFSCGDLAFVPAPPFEHIPLRIPKVNYPVIGIGLPPP